MATHTATEQIMAPDSVPVADDSGPGAALRRAREAANLSREQLADDLKLEIEIVSALEHDDYGQLPERPYVKGYIRAYARLVEVDEKPLVERFDRLHVADAEWNVHSPVEHPSDHTSALQWGTLGVGLVAFILGTAWWLTEHYPATEVPIQEEQVQRLTPGDDPVTFMDLRPIENDWERETQSAPEPPRQQESSAAAPPTLQESTASPAQGEDAQSPQEEIPAVAPTALDPAPTVAEELQSVPTVAEVLQSVPTVAEVLQSVPTVAEEPVSEVPQALPSESDTLFLRFQEDSWVDISDATGEKLFKGLSKAGTEREIVGTAPFRVFLGNSPGVDVRFNGKVFDQSQYNRANKTARFRLEDTAAQ